MSDPPRPADPFSGTHFYFRHDPRPGQIATIEDRSGRVRLTYRTFANVIGIVALFVAGVVLLAGAAATLFLVAEQRGSAAGAAAALSLVFSGVIAGMVPPVRVTLFEGQDPALTIVQQSRFTFPYATYAVSDRNGETIALIRSGVLSRLGRNRWRFASPAHSPRNGYAIEESLANAIARKMLGKFSRRFQSDLIIMFEGSVVGQIVRRPDDAGDFDYLEIVHDTELDHRAAVAVATLVFGEP